MEALGLDSGTSAIIVSLWENDIGNLLSALYKTKFGVRQTIILLQIPDHHFTIN